MGSMRKGLIAVATALLATLALIAPAAAQYGDDPSVSFDNPTFVSCHVEVGGTGFTPNSTITLTTTSVASASPARFRRIGQSPTGIVFTPAQPVTDDEGSFRADIDIPASVPAGAQFVVTSTDEEGLTASGVITQGATAGCPVGDDGTGGAGAGGAGAGGAGTGAGGTGAGTGGGGAGLAFTGTNAISWMVRVGVVLAAGGGMLLLISRRRRFESVG